MIWALVACAAPELAGAWDGAVNVDGAAWPLSADLAETDGVLTGTVTVDEPDALHVYAVRRATGADLDLTDVADPTRGLELDGDTDGAAYTGDAEVRFACDAGTCGWAGTFSLTLRTPPASTR